MCLCLVLMVGFVAVDGVQHEFGQDVQVLAGQVFVLPEAAEGASASAQTDDGQRQEDSSGHNSGGGSGSSVAPDSGVSTAVLADVFGQSQTGQAGQFGQLGQLQLGLGVL